MSIKIMKPALMTSLVSDGREGFRSLGIGPTGAMDYFAMKVANYLVGNDREAVLELGGSSAEVLFQNDCIISLTGKGFGGEVNESELQLWKPIQINEGSILRLKKKTGGVWAYLSVHGGWSAQVWLNSLTTNLNAQAGGYKGRALKKDDVVEEIERKRNFNEIRILPWGISTTELSAIYSPPTSIRCAASVETELISHSSMAKFTSEEFHVTTQSNRMGYRLKGDPISLNEKAELISSPVDFGTVQLLPDGNLIVLMADHQTTGGYPRIASVIKADLPKLAQLTPGEKLNFKMVSLKEAEAELQSRQQKLDDLKQSCHERFKKHLHQ